MDFTVINESAPVKKEWLIEACKTQKEFESLYQQNPAPMAWVESDPGIFQDKELLKKYINAMPKKSKTWHCGI